MGQVSRFPLWLAALLLPLLPVCSQVRTISEESIACSFDEDDDPFRECNISAADLVCIGTYRKGQDGKAIPYVCRMACDTSAQCNGEDVCCRGPIYGRNFGKQAACVPSKLCDPTIAGGEVITDAGRPDATDAQAADAASPGQ